MSKPVFASSINIDSLEQVVDHPDSPFKKVDALVILGNKLIHTEPQKAENYSNEALSLSKRLNYSKGEAGALLNLASLMREKGNSLQKALEYDIRALRIYERLGDKNGLAHGYFEMGYIQKVIQNYEKASDCYAKSLKLYKEIHLDLNATKCEMVMAHVQVDLAMKKKDFSHLLKAEKLYHSSLNYYMKSGDVPSKATIYINLANLSLRFFEFKKKKEFLKQSIDYSHKSMLLSSQDYYVGMNLLNIGEAYYLLDQKDSALAYYQKAKPFSVLSKDVDLQLFIDSKTMQVLDDSGRYNELQKISEAFIRLAESNSMNGHLKSHYDFLAGFYRKQNDFKNAYECRLLFQKYSDRILNEEKAAALVKFQIEFDSQNKDKEIELLSKNDELKRKQLQQQQVTRNFLIAVIILICFLLVVIYSRFVVKRRSHKVIQEKNLELEKLSIVARETATGVLITDAKGNIEWFNEGFFKLFKWNSREEYLEKRGSNIYQVSGNSRINELIDAAIEERGSVAYENAVKRKDGVELWIQTNLTPIFDKDWNLQKLVFVETDVTELKSAQETAELALEIQEQFLANTSHEIRTPMNGIMGIVRHLRETNLTSEQQVYLDIIAESSNNLLHVVNDILDISKIRAGKISFESTKFRIGDLFNSLRMSQLLHTEEKGIYLKSYIDPKIPDVLVGDPIRINQILLNIVANAIKFTEEGGVLFSAKKVRSLNNSVVIEFSVVDTGIGIAQDKLDYVFESFTQAEQHISRKYGGTGLGLSISKSMIEQLGGTLAIQSELGHGSKLTFTLSFEIGDQNWKGITFQQFDGIPENVDLSDLNVLVVEDNQINQMVALFELNKWKAKTEIAENAMEAFEALDKTKFDVVLMDISMPEMDGLEATRRIRESAKTLNKQVPIIAMTASALAGEKNKCYEAGMNDYISKPFTPINLYSKLVKWGRGEQFEMNIESEIDVLGSEDIVVHHVLDLSLIYERASGDMEYLKEMFELFSSEMPEYVEELNSAFKRSDFESVRSVAHKIVSPSALFGANELCTILREIEIKALEDPNSIKALIHEANELFVKAFAEIKVAKSSLNN